MPDPDSEYDRAIDSECEMLDIGEHSYYASEVLYSVDNDAYVEMGERLCGESVVPNEEPKAE